MATNSPFSNLKINRKSIEAVVLSNGYGDFTYRQAGNMFHLTCTKDAKNIKLGVFENKNGTTTLICLDAQNKAVFGDLATLIREKCATGAPGRVDFSIRNVKPDVVAPFLAFLASECVTVNEQQPTDKCKQHRCTGKQGDTLTVNVFTNGTVQCQGAGGMLAAHAIDYLSNVLTFKETIALQLQTFKVEMTVEAALDGLAGSLTKSYPKLGETVKAQFASALALTKVEMELADFGAIAFPALRGLEGVLKSELTNGGFELKKFSDFGEYFEPTTVGQFAMKTFHASVAKEPRAAELARLYTLFNNQRHGLAHMGADPETSRVLATMDEAKSIVNDVFGSIEYFFGVVYP
jgi:hypothetical protein